VTPIRGINLGRKFVGNRNPSRRSFAGQHTMSIKLIGRTTDFKGKPLWEILGNLKNFGVGRIVIRNLSFRDIPSPVT